MCFTEARYGPLRQLTVANSDHPDRTVQTRALHACLSRRNANTRHPGVLAAQHRERARNRSEKGLRWVAADHCRPRPDHPTRRR